MFNPDGSEAEVCGNGLACFAKYVIDRGLADARELAVETAAGVRKIKPCMIDGLVEQVQMDMGIPKFKPEEIPVSIGEVDIIPILDYPIDVGGKELFLTFVSMGNPHAVCFVEKSVSDFPLSELGPLIEHHPIFPQRANFEVVNVLSRGQVKARVWERGARETLACGSGACAVAVAAQLHGYVDNEVGIMLPGGTLSVEWDGKEEVRLSGPAEFVFTGEWIER
jgi:diaminopimelate epimerase